MTTTTNTTKKLKSFRIYYKTEFGIACFNLKASSFENAFSRLNSKHKSTLLEIYDIDLEESFYPQEIQTKP
jgi:hypothetical protein